MAIYYHQAKQPHRQHKYSGNMKIVQSKIKIKILAVITVQGYVDLIQLWKACKPQNITVVGRTFISNVVDSYRADLLIIRRARYRLYRSCFKSALSPIMINIADC